MTDHKNALLTPLIVAAAVSVVTFSGIGIAAITGNLSIAHSNLNPFSNFSIAPVSGIIQAPAIASATHQGLTRNRGETLVEGKPVNFQRGVRIPSRKTVCLNCGVVDSILPGRTQSAQNDFATVLRIAGSVVDRAAELHKAGFVVTVHMENGTVRTVYESERPSFDIGERVKLVNGSVVRLG